MPDSIQESLWCRGVSDDQMALYRVGYVDRKLPEGVEYPNTFLEWSEEGAKLKDSLVFPLTNWLGEVRGVQFRPARREDKGYRDFIVDKTQTVLFGLSQAAPHVWATGKVCLVEGVFDLFPVQRFAPHVITTLTARASDQLVRSLYRFVQRVQLMFDDDPPGKRGTNKFIQFHGPLFDTSVVEYPTGVVMANGKLAKDPGEIWEAWGDDRLSGFFRPQLE